MKECSLSLIKGLSMQECISLTQSLSSQGVKFVVRTYPLSTLTAARSGCVHLQFLIPHLRPILLVCFKLLLVLLNLLCYMFMILFGRAATLHLMLCKIRLCRHIIIIIITLIQRCTRTNLQARGTVHYQHQNPLDSQQQNTKTKKYKYYKCIHQMINIKMTNLN